MTAHAAQIVLAMATVITAKKATSNQSSLAQSMCVPEPIKTAPQHTQKRSRKFQSIVPAHPMRLADTQT